MTGNPLLGRPDRRLLLLGVVLVVLTATLWGGSRAAYATGSPGTLPAPSSVEDNLSVQTTSSFSFVPNMLTVSPGAEVHLVVTQESIAAHTFVLSSVRNFTIPTSDSPSQLYAFFNAHPPLVNLSLPGTVGAQAFANFTAPAVGSWEFVCEIPGHFQAGMYGFLVSTTGSGSSPSASPFTPTVLVTLAGLVVVVAAVSVIALRRRSRRPPT